MRYIRVTLVAFSVAFLATTAGGVSVLAQSAMGGKKPPARTSAPAVVIYLSKPSKMGFTKAQAERMGLKDMKGVRLIKSTFLPPGYKMAPVTMGRKHETMGEVKGGNSSLNRTTPP